MLMKQDWGKLLIKRCITTSTILFKLWCNDHILFLFFFSNSWLHYQVSRNMGGCCTEVICRNMVCVCSWIINSALSGSPTETVTLTQDDGANTSALKWQVVSWCQPLCQPLTGVTHWALPASEAASVNWITLWAHFTPAPQKASWNMD